MNAQAVTREFQGSSLPSALEGVSKLSRPIQAPGG
jgi:hypothetical protein